MNEEICNYRNELYELKEQQESLDCKIYEMREKSKKIERLLDERRNLEREIAYFSMKIDEITQKTKDQEELNKFEEDEE
tara:strand:- start:228 stop:464 length:237 start_codon:yes stop_codon:yes gene_type:complete